MTTAEFKRIGRLLKLAYQELEKELAPLDPSSIEYELAYDTIQEKLRDKILQNHGYTTSEYRLAKAVAIREQEEERQQLIASATTNG